MIICPEYTETRPATAFINVLFPAPLTPRTAEIWPVLKFADTPLTTGMPGSYPASIRCSTTASPGVTACMGSADQVGIDDLWIQPELRHGPVSDDATRCHDNNAI